LALPHLKKEVGSSILIILSIIGYEYIWRPLFHYAVTKTALLGLTKTLAHELLDDNIRVNAIAPGMIKTKLSGYHWELNKNKRG
jgi:NAD(P)-dependent dehydrogenase (short-subunit alcohol dehydrogenase family)